MCETDTFDCMRAIYWSIRCQLRFFFFFDRRIVLFFVGFLTINQSILFLEKWAAFKRGFDLVCTGIVVAIMPNNYIHSFLRILLRVNIENVRWPSVALLDRSSCKSGWTIDRSATQKAAERWVCSCGRSSNCSSAAGLALNRSIRRRFDRFHHLHSSCCLHS